MTLRALSISPYEQGAAERRLHFRRRLPLQLCLHQQHGVGTDG